MLKSIFRFELKWIIHFLVIIAGFILVLKYNEKKEDSATNADNTIMAKEHKPYGDQSNAQNINVKVEKAVICLDVDNGKPLVAKSKFSKTVDYLFCYSVMKSPVSGGVVHQWIYRNQIMAEKKLNYKQGENAVWSKYKIPSKASGEWRVDILTRGGTFLNSVRFQLK